MEIAIYNPGMPCGPDTLKLRSLGGSESAALNVAKELVKRGHLVNFFTNLPPKGRPDYVDPGTIGEDGVRYIPLQAYNSFITTTEVDLLVVSRAVEPFMLPHQAKKAVLWMHDLATYTGLSQQMIGHSWNFDEIWAVSEFHMKQIHEVTGFPIKHIRATRNGITKLDLEPQVLPRSERVLLYAARPERGLENLVRPGGIMSRLPEFELQFSMYDNFPEHMAGYYKQLFSWAGDLSNVTNLGILTQQQLRERMGMAAAYVYPTRFEEVSCIIAREAIEQHLPVLTTNAGALPETLGDCARYLEVQDWPGEWSRQWTDDECQKFADMVRGYFEDPQPFPWDQRADLYWDGVAEQWEQWAEPREATLYSRLWSMIEESDIVPAKALYEAAPMYKRTPEAEKLYQQIEDWYPYLFGRETFESYYQRYYAFENTKGHDRQPHEVGSNRYNAIRAQVAALPKGSTILDYGCAEGGICVPLAAEFRDLHFVGVDFVEGNLDLAARYADKEKCTNIQFTKISEIKEIRDLPYKFDAVICTEVLEHTLKPWETIFDLEQCIRVGGRVIVSVPAGPWEMLGLRHPKQWYWRAHIWHVDKWMLREMFKAKPNLGLQALNQVVIQTGRHVGHMFAAYDADHVPVPAIDPLEKAKHSRMYQTCAAAIIAHEDEDCILKMLNSIHTQVGEIQIALSEASKDDTLRIISKWAADHPWVSVKLKRVPKIEAGKFGFDDARNASMEGLESDWILWIDCDEYLVGDIRKYLRQNSFDSYAIHQHHFTVDPRGAPAMLDKPARIFRNDGSFQFYGKVHEHAEKGFNGGPGHSLVLSDIDLGHTGYVNEAVRQDRFQRNYPFMEWDRKVYPERRLGQYLWLRDTIHKMRFAAAHGNVPLARALAEEAVAFFHETGHNYRNIGNGIQMSLDYYSEALTFLNRGFTVELAMKCEDMQFAYRGRFEDAKQALEVAEIALSDDLKRRQSKYWR